MSEQCICTGKVNHVISKSSSNSKTTSDESDNDSGSDGRENTDSAVVKTALSTAVDLNSNSDIHKGGQAGSPYTQLCNKIYQLASEMCKFHKQEHENYPIWLFYVNDTLRKKVDSLEACTAEQTARVQCQNLFVVLVILHALTELHASLTQNVYDTLCAPLRAEDEQIQFVKKLSHRVEQLQDHKQVPEQDHEQQLATQSLLAKLSNAVRETLQETHNAMIMQICDRVCASETHLMQLCNSDLSQVKAQLLSNSTLWTDGIVAFFAYKLANDSPLHTTCVTKTTHVQHVEQECGADFLDCLCDCMQSVC